MLDVYTDLTQQSSVFGTHIELIEMCEVEKYRSETPPTEVNEKLMEFASTFDIAENCDRDEMGRAARTSVALDKMVKAHNLGSLAYYYEGESGNNYENIVTPVVAGNTLLTGKIFRWRANAK
jgi:L-arabinose isomerase